MPELPEIETIRKGLEFIKNKKIEKFFRSEHKLRIDNDLDFDQLIHQKILAIYRQARYLLIDLSNNKTLILHLGMSGRITLNKNFHKLKHDHFACYLSSDEWLIYNDPRRFGFVDLIKTDEISNHKMLKNLGVEPLSPDFNDKYLYAQLKNKTSNIKTTMMDNKIVVGVGNIYVNESLFDARISPLREANSLNKNEIKKLVESIKKIIANAIEMGGSSISDYQNAKGELGFFQNLHKVYDRHNQKCFDCDCNIERIVQNQRSSFYCKFCKK